MTDREPINWWTPGPWIVDETGRLLIVRAQYGTLTLLVAAGNDIHERERANAHLIAAAPDLLVAAKKLLQKLDEYAKDGLDVPAESIDLDAAVAKAERLKP